MALATTLHHVSGQDTGQNAAGANMAQIPAAAAATATAAAAESITTPRTTTSTTSTTTTTTTTETPEPTTKRRFQIRIPDDEEDEFLPSILEPDLALDININNLKHILHQYLDLDDMQRNIDEINPNPFRPTVHYKTGERVFRILEEKYTLPKAEQYCAKSNERLYAPETEEEIRDLNRLKIEKMWVSMASLSLYSMDFRVYANGRKIPTVFNLESIDTTGLAAAPAQDCPVFDAKIPAFSASNCNDKLTTICTEKEVSEKLKRYNELKRWFAPIKVQINHFFTWFSKAENRKALDLSTLEEKPCTNAIKIFSHVYDSPYSKEPHEFAFKRTRFLQKVDWIHKLINFIKYVKNSDHAVIMGLRVHRNNNNMCIRFKKPSVVALAPTGSFLQFTLVDLILAAGTLLLAVVALINVIATCLIKKDNNEDLSRSNSESSNEDNDTISNKKLANIETKKVTFSKGDSLVNRAIANSFMTMPTLERYKSSDESIEPAPENYFI